MALLNELLQYVYRVIDSKNTQQLDIDTISGVITSPLTLIKLRLEVAKYNFGFFVTRLMAIGHRLIDSLIK